MSRENQPFGEGPRRQNAQVPDSQRSAMRRPGPTGRNTETAAGQTRIPRSPGRHASPSPADAQAGGAKPMRPPFPSRTDRLAGEPGTREEPPTPTARPTDARKPAPPIRPAVNGRPRASAAGDDQPRMQPGKAPRPTSHRQASQMPAGGASPIDGGWTSRPAQPTSAHGGKAQRPASLAAAYGRATTEPEVPVRLPSRAQETKTKRQVKKRRQSKIKTGAVLTAVTAILLVCIYIAYTSLTGGNTPVEADDYPGPGTTEVIAVVNPGDTGLVIAKNLVELKVVKSEAAFIKAWEANQAASSVQPGSYTLKQEMSSGDAVAALLDPTKRTSNAVSIASGYTIWQVAERLKANVNFTAEEVDAAIANPEGIGLPAEAGGNLEGWLQPGSYEVHSNDKPADVLRAMVKARIAELDSLNVPANQRQTVLIKASILEREVTGPTYMRKVARVIENRLTKPDSETVGLLQMDSTVLYGLQRSGGIPSGEEIKKDTPYNTYLHKGLPPAPISMPSKAAIEATLDPEVGDWLYFVTVNLDTGETKFSSNLKEHQVFVEELKAWRKANKG